MNEKELDASRAELLATMRAAFPLGNYVEVITAFEALGETKSIRSGIRVEAIALAARVKLAQGDKQAAKQLIKQVWNAPLKSHRLYRHVAIACLEMGEYNVALNLVNRAVQLAEQAKEQAAVD
jgi:tetratricopeptide (TPR) repeat protein